MEAQMTLSQELDALVEETRRDLPPGDLIHIQTQISAIKYTLSTQMAKREGQMLAAKEMYEKHVLRERFRMQAEDGKLSTAKANDAVEVTEETEKLRQEVIRTKIHYSALKNRVDNAKDVLVGLSVRLKALEQEQRESRLHT
jgi:hypothetical protein